MRLARHIAGTVLAAAIMLANPGLALATAAQITKGALPPPDSAAALLGDAQAYQIAPTDTLQVDVFNVESLSRTVQVDAAGRIDLPLIGGVVASKKTASQLADEISARLAEKYLQSPRVTVSVKQAATRNFTVEGAVKEPGVFEWQERVTLLQAIARAKGADPSARVRQILIFRTVRQQRVAGLFNLEDIRTGKVDDPSVYPDDVVVVADSKSQRALRQIVGLTPLFLIFGF